MTKPLILFVCTANICRSAWAEARAAQLLPGFEIASAGTHALRGEPIDPTMAQTLPGGAAKSTVAQQVTRSLIDEAAVVLAMESRHRLWVLEEFPAAIRRTFTLGQFVETLRSAPSRLALGELITWAYQHRTPTGKQTDIPDPYGQGLSAAGVTASQLESLLTEMAGPLNAARVR